jgi:hypothetical protein
VRIGVQYGKRSLEQDSGQEISHKRDITTPADAREFTTRIFENMFSINPELEDGME